MCKLLVILHSSIHPLPTVWSTTEAWDLVLVVLNVELVVIAELVKIEERISKRPIHLTNENNLC